MEKFKVNVKLKLKERLQERGMEQKELAEITGVSVRTISELVNNKTERVPKCALERICDALEIKDINELITLVELDENEGGSEG